MKLFTIIALVGVVGFVSVSSREIKFRNTCEENIWISPLENDDEDPLEEGILSLAPQATGVYQIPDSGWGGRFWPKMGCDSTGHNCEVGQSMEPCLPAGCDPPAETKVEFNFPAIGDTLAVWYDVSLVDGYSLPAEIVPSQVVSCL